MHNTLTGLWALQQHRRRSSEPPSPSPSESPCDTTTYSVRAPTGVPFTFSSSSLTGSTVWGPGALTGKALKLLGEKVEGAAEYLVIRNKLSQISKRQPQLLGSARTLTPEEDTEITDQCKNLVELCITGMRYPPSIMTRAFCLMLSGFKRPGREIWIYHIAEAISKRDIICVFQIFENGFFTLLDDSVFRVDGFVDLETLKFRCPAVTDAIARIISHLARNDCAAASVHASPRSSVLTLASDTTISRSFSSAIITAGFFRLATRWAERGLPHWDLRGRERLEKALEDVADAQILHGDLGENAEEAKELIRKLQGKRLLILDDVLETEEPDDFSR